MGHRDSQAHSQTSRQVDQQAGRQTRKWVIETGRLVYRQTDGQVDRQEGGL